MAKDHSVGPGDCFASIAKANNFFNYRLLYDHAENATIKSRRPNPNQLVEDDVVRVPDKRQKKVHLTLDDIKKLFVDRKDTKLRLVVTDSMKAKLIPWACELKVGSATTTSFPGSQGLIELVIDPAKNEGTLKMTFAALPPPGPAAKDPMENNPPSNPPVIQPSKFVDRLPKAPIEALEVTIELEIGSLEPKDAIRGTFHRLANLTYDVPIRKDENDETKQQVKGYQALIKATSKTGNVSDIGVHLAIFHDNP